jgi:hypothetical protein
VCIKEANGPCSLSNLVLPEHRHVT